MNTQSSSTGRWIFFIPVALIASYLVSLIVTFFIGLAGVVALVSTGHGTLYLILMSIIVGFTDAAAYFAVGISLAPEPKKIAAIWLIVVGVAISFIRIFFFGRNEPEFGTVTMCNTGAYLLTLALGLLFVPKPKPTLEEYLAQMNQESAGVWPGNKIEQEL